MHTVALKEEAVLPGVALTSLLLFLIVFSILPALQVLASQCLLSLVTFPWTLRLEVGQRGVKSWKKGASLGERCSR